MEDNLSVTKSQFPDLLKHWIKISDSYLTAYRQLGTLKKGILQEEGLYDGYF